MSTLNSRESIEKTIPHRAPMLLVDEVVSCEGKTIVCRKTFRPDEYFVQGHYPGNPIVPGVILCECAAQSGALLIAQHVSDKGGVPVLTRISDARFKQIVRPGDTIEIHVELEDIMRNAFFLGAKVMVNGKLSVRLSLTCAVISEESSEA